jgi:integrase/recombinase XerD
MLNYSHNGITISSILDTRRENKNNNFPIKIRVTYARDRKYYSTGKSLSVTEWEKLPITKNRAYSEIKTDIQSSFDKVKHIVQVLEAEGNFSFNSLNNRLGKCLTDSLNSAFNAKIQTLEKEGRAGTQVYYNCALTSIEKFRGENIQFTSINEDWLKQYEKYMLDQGRTYTTIGMYLRAIRTLMNDAKRNDVIKDSQYPFGKGKYEIPIGLGRKLALTLSQIKSIVQYEGNPVTEKYRDLWFFSYLCNGINFTDLIQLKYSNIQNGEISYFRAKTIRTSKVKKEIHAILTPEIEMIIKKWGNHKRKPDQYIFPYLNGNESQIEIRAKAQDIIHRTNDRLKEIGKDLKIDNLSTYSARHSFATVLKRSGANIAFISESLGHADQKTTENYLASFEQERIKNAALLTKF